MKKYIRNTNYFEAFHTVHASTQSFLFIPTKSTKYVKYIYLLPIASCMFWVFVTPFLGTIALLSQKLHPFCIVVVKCTIKEFNKHF